MAKKNDIESHMNDYSARIQRLLADTDWKPISTLGNAMLNLWRKGNQMFICGNGGSAGNAIHLANDYLYGIGKTANVGMRVSALPANGAVITCLANDVSYESIYSEQLKVLGQPGDLLLVLSGSGNSPNVISALNMANKMNMETFAILGFDGGKCKELAKNPIHFPVNDMQISEDMQLIVGHMVMQWLCKM